MDPTVEGEDFSRVAFTAAAVAQIQRLIDRNGPLIFHQSGGCCDGSSPMCFPEGDFVTGDADVKMGHVEVPLPDGTTSPLDFWMSREQFTYWRHTHLTIDLVDGRGGGFSLETPDGKRFLTRSRMLEGSTPSTHRRPWRRTDTSRWASSRRAASTGSIMMVPMTTRRTASSAPGARPRRPLPPPAPWRRRSPHHRVVDVDPGRLARLPSSLEPLDDRVPRSRRPPSGGHPGVRTADGGVLGVSLSVFVGRPSAPEPRRPSGRPGRWPAHRAAADQGRR